MDVRVWAADNLAARLLARPWTLRAVTDAVDAALRGVPARTRAALAVRVFALGEDTYPPSLHRLKSFLQGSRFFRLAEGAAVAVELAPARFAPLGRLAGLGVPEIATLGALGEWLGETAEQLEWLADGRRGHGRAVGSALQHYTYAFAEKRDGGVRLIEAPKPRLKAIQRRILRELLSAVPVHDRAYGFVAGRSCLDGAQVHASEAVVATFDLAKFFPSIGLGRVHGVFRSLGYPWAVARCLAGLCTTVTPGAVLARMADGDAVGQGVRAVYGVPHLAQGAPTSPALANLLAWRLDVRLAGLARAAGAAYTRYADDLAFSGDAAFAKKVDGFGRSVGAIVGEEGFVLNGAKTRVMAASQRQRVTGIVVNAHCNVGRAEFDVLKATLHNCVRSGAGAQNRRGLADFRRHLDGRVVWVERVNPARGAKLREMFGRITWEDGGPAG